MKQLILSVLFIAACKKDGTSCEQLFEHTVSIMPAEMQSQMKDDKAKAKAIEKCEKLSPEARQCAADAKSIEDLMKCPKS